MKKEVITSGFKNSILTSSPGKINSLKKVESKEEWMDFGLVTTIASVLVLQGKDSWGIEELESVKINYELGPKLLIFLKKLGVLPKVFKKILRGEKSMTLGELRGEGLFVNQKENGEDQEKKEEKKVEKEDEKKQE